jgi:cytochrome c oxidase accessory protein FixG
MVAQNDAAASRAVEKSRPAKPARKLPVVTSGHRLHRARKLIHLACVIVFVALPFFDVMRFDIPAQRFYFLGYQLWISEFGILFFTIMFLMFVIVAASMLYGRIYCGFLCPQMIFGEAASALEARITKWVNKRWITVTAVRRKWLARGLFTAALGVASVFLAFVFISYFVEPRDLLGRLARLDVQTAGGIAGAATTLLTFADFAFLRQKFCTTVCPYGYLQGMLGDANTLVVQYRDEKNECIQCKKCVRICHMGIDIRNGPYQIECIHCGECVEACAEIMAKVGKSTLIHYAWGDKGELLGDRAQSLLKRLGLRDAKRVVVALILLFYAAGLFTVLSMRRDVLVRMSPVRATLFRVGDDGRIYNTFRVTVANRGSEHAIVFLSLDGLPGASVPAEASAIPVEPGEQATAEFEVAVSPAALPPGVNHFAFVQKTSPGDETDSFPMTFITPTERKT